MRFNLFKTIYLMLKFLKKFILISAMKRFYIAYKNYDLSVKLPKNKIDYEDNIHPLF